MAHGVCIVEKGSLLNCPSLIVCHVCQKQFSQYTCPRCNCRYCSLHCYKSHDLHCTESFMRENVMEELHQMQPTDETKQKMLDILKRFNLADGIESTDEKDSVLSEEIAQKILSGEAISFDDLSLEEKKRFRRALACGDLSKSIKPWQPWWLHPSARKISLTKQGTKLIQVVVEPDASLPPQPPSSSLPDHDQISEIPPGPDSPLALISMLCYSNPSSLLPIHLVDIIYSYCFALRFYNGDWRSDAVGAAMVLLAISSVLSYARQPETVFDALSACLERTCSSSYKHVGGLCLGLALIEDVAHMISLKNAGLICALCDLQRLLQAGMMEIKGDKLCRKNLSRTMSKLKLAERKVYFMTCWVHEQLVRVWVDLAAIVAAEKRMLVDVRHGSKTLEDGQETNTKSLIQEM